MLKVKFVILWRNTWLLLIQYDDVSHTVEQETDIYGPLPPKIDSDKYVDEHFMAAVPGMSELRVMGNLTLLSKIPKTDDRCMVIPL